MKKVLFILFLASTILLFSCASKKTSEDENVPVAPESTEEMEKDLTLPEENNNLAEETSNVEEIKNEDTAENLENTDINYNSDNLNEYEDELSEIEEPEVFELEITTDEDFIDQNDAETAQSDEDINPESTNNLEEVSEEDLITNVIEDEEVIIVENQDDDEVENLLEETENQEDSIESTDTNDEVELIEEDEGPDPEESKLIIPTRSLSVNKLEYIDVTYPGKGWVFMGLTDNSKSLIYLGRKIGSNDTKFTLQARNSGTYVLHFYKNDSLTNEYLDDYLEIIISEEKSTDKKHVEAPKYVPLLPEQKKAYIEKKAAEALRIETEKTSDIQENTEKKESITVPEKKQQIIEEPKVEKEIPQKTEKIDSVEVQPEVKTEEPIVDSNQLYNEAMTAYKSNDLVNAEQKLLQGIEYATSGKDKYLYWLGQIYEKESPLQNINKAIEEYTLLVNNYPASSYWEKANKRIIYLKRFYIEGR